MQSEPLPQTSPPLTLRSRLGPVFWLVLVGAIIGILFGIGEIGRNVDALPTLGSSYPGPTKLALTYIAGGMGMIVFSVIGLVAGFGITEEKGPSALLVILAGVGILTCFFWGLWGTVIPATFFFIGGALLYLKKG